MLRAPLSTTRELGTQNGASTMCQKGPTAVPGATTGTLRVASQTKQNKTTRSDQGQPTLPGGVGQLGMAHPSDGPASSLRMPGHVHRAMCGGGCQSLGRGGINDGGGAASAFIQWQS